MHGWQIMRIGAVGAGLALLVARPAHGDLTVIGHYTFVNGDTATRASYFSTRRQRLSTPDGREVIFDSHTHRVTLIDHARRLYWDGPLARADSIVDVLDASRWNLYLRHAADTLRAEWRSDMDLPTDSIHVDEGFATRNIAGYPCNLWTVRAGPYLSLQRWVAYSLSVQDYDVQTEEVVLSAVLDPIGRAVMGMFWDTQEEADALPLAATMTFDTPTEHGRFHWEAVRVIGARIPDSAWHPPAGYARVNLDAATPVE